MSKLVLRFLICIVLLHSCLNDKPSDNIGKERLKAFNVLNTDQSQENFIYDSVWSINLEETIPVLPSASELFENREFIILKTPEDEIIGEISKMHVSESGIVILDKRITKKVYLFRPNGDFIHVVGQIGNGPGEYSDPLDVMVRNGLVFIVDRQFSIHAYDFNNNFLRKVNLPFHAGSGYVFKNGTFAFSNNLIGEPDINYHLMFIKEFDLSKRYFAHNSEVLTRYTVPPISSNPKYHNDSFLFFKSHGNEIYEANEETLKLRFKLTSDDLLTEELLTEDFDRFSDSKFDYSWIFEFPILETKEFVQIRANHRGLITLLINKNDSTIRTYSGMRDDLLFGGIQDFPTYANGEYFFMPINVEQLYSVKRQIAQIEDEKVIENLRENRDEVFRLLQQVDEISNPIIMKCELR